MKLLDALPKDLSAITDVDIVTILQMLIKASKEVAPELAKLKRTYYESLVKAGFTSNQAIELVKVHGKWSTK